MKQVSMHTKAHVSYIGLLTCT